MAIRTVLQYPNPILRQESSPVRDFNDPALKLLIGDMKETMIAHDGWGLAAPQIGESIALFVLLEDIAPSGHTVFMNPRILSVSQDTEHEEEGCLSFTGRYTDIARPSRVEIEAHDEDGNKFRAHGEGVLARAFLHETDHLRGILFIDHMHEL